MRWSISSHGRYGGKAMTLARRNVMVPHNQATHREEQMTILGSCRAPRDCACPYSKALDVKHARRRAGLAALLAVTALGSCLGVSVVPASAAEVTYQRLLNASYEPQNWLMR